MIGKVAFWVAAGAIVLIFVRLTLLSFLSRTLPEGLGVDNGRLAPCPRKRNCVSSLALGKAHSIEPLRVTGAREEALAAARRAIESMPGARIVTVADRYLHAEFSSHLFRFVDDLELLYDEDAGLFQVRSASRVGNADLGANRKRVEVLRLLLSGAKAASRNSRHL